MKSFLSSLQENNLNIRRTHLEIVQVNIGKVCNQACYHCHVESSPQRTENMDQKTVDRLIDLIKISPSFHTVDITGGAPELNPYFRKLVLASKEAGKHVIDRCNLTILFEPRQEDTAIFLSENEVQIVASLPCYSKQNVEKQRGRGVFSKSIQALKLLNDLGYGRDEKKILHLVYNPIGAYLPPDQKKLEKDYKRELKDLFDIDFNNLYTITNMPIKRFLQDLRKQDLYEEYMDLLIKNFNPKATQAIMCKNLVSVAYNGEIFDCDFNQMLELPLGSGKKTIWDVDSFEEGFEGKGICFSSHCYACTAGSGSSCQGVTA